MELKVRKIGNGYGVLLPRHLLDETGLEEGSTIRFERGEGGVYRMKPPDDEFKRQVETFLRTEERHRNTYRTLAQ